MHILSVLYVGYVGSLEIFINSFFIPQIYYILIKLKLSEYTYACTYKIFYYVQIEIVEACCSIIKPSKYVDLKCLKSVFG